MSGCVINFTINAFHGGRLTAVVLLLLLVVVVGLMMKVVLIVADAVVIVHIQTVADLGVEGQTATAIPTGGHCSHWKFIKQCNQLFSVIDHMLENIIDIENGTIARLQRVHCNLCFGRLGGGLSESLNGEINHFFDGE